VAVRVELALPVGARRRQLSVRTLLVGILLALGDQRPGHLVRVHRALVSLPEHDRRRLGVVAQWKGGPHLLTYRQVEYTFSVMVAALGKEHPDGSPSDTLCSVVDALVEASVPERWKAASTSLAVDWSDHESFACPPPKDTERCADPEASWGHRRGGPHRGDLFFGYYFQAATMVNDEGSSPVPELVRRMLLTSCAIDAPPALVAVLARLVGSGVALGDVLCDSGYAHRVPEHWALAVRRLGGILVMDLHPHDRGTQGTHQGAVRCNGSLYCPATPSPLFDIGPLGRSAGAEETTTHDERSAELDRYRLGRITADDGDGFHRVMCPAALGKVRCPQKPTSLALSFDHPTVAQPDPTPTCCIQQTITVGPEVNAKTAQKHPYPSKAHRRSYARRTAVERSYSTMKDPASTDTTRGWCRVMGLCAVTLFLACGVVVRNQRVADAFDERQRENLRRVEAGLPPKSRPRRRRTIDDLIAAPAST
jgi:hypothetical protein